MILSLILLPSGCKLEWVMTKDRKKIAHLKMCELATYTDDVINPKHTAGWCGTFIRPVTGCGSNSNKNLSKDSGLFSVPSRVLWDYLSASQTNGRSWKLTKLFLLPLASHMLCHAQINFRLLSWLLKCHLKIFRLSICQASLCTWFLAFPFHPHASLTILSLSLFQDCILNGYQNLIGYRGSVLFVTGR